MHLNCPILLQTVRNFVHFLGQPEYFTHSVGSVNILAIFGKTVLATLFNTVPSGVQKVVFLQIIIMNEVSKHLSFHLRPLVLS